MSIIILLYINFKEKARADDRVLHLSLKMKEVLGSKTSLFGRYILAYCGKSIIPPNNQAMSILTKATTLNPTIIK